MENLEPEIERLLGRFHIPAEDGQLILDEVMLAMLTKRDRIRDPERWLMRTLRNRCLLYWQDRRRRLYRVVDSGILALLTADGVEEEEKEALREELRQLVGGLRRECRDVLTRRYGLKAGRVRVDPRPWDPQEESSEMILRCVGALTRCLSRKQPPAGPILDLIEGGEES